MASKYCIVYRTLFQNHYYSVFIAFLLNSLVIKEYKKTSCIQLKLRYVKKKVINLCYTLYNNICYLKTDT